MGLRLNVNQAVLITIFFLMSVHLLTTNPTQAPGKLFTLPAEHGIGMSEPSIRPSTFPHALWVQEINDTVPLEIFNTNGRTLQAPAKISVTLHRNEGVKVFCGSLNTAQKLHVFASTTSGGVDIFLLEERGSDWVVKEKFGTSGFGSVEKTLPIPRSTTWILIFMNYKVDRIYLTLEVMILEEKPVGRTTGYIYLGLLILLAGLGIKSLTTPVQYRFQFRVAPTPAASTQPMYAYGKIQKIAERIKEATSPYAFTYKTFWARGTIQLTSEEPETIVTGTVRRPWGIREWVILLAFLAIFYGVVGSLIILPLYLVFFLLFDIIGNTPRKAIGSQLRLALDGEQFHQTSKKVSLARGRGASERIRERIR